MIRSQNQPKQFRPFMSTRNYHVEMLNSHKVLNSDPLVFHSAPI